VLWSRYSWNKADTGAPAAEPVFISVIIPARNEEENIGPCLRSVLDQSYPEDTFEIIVIDDHSTDQTAAIVKSFTDERIQLIRLGEIMKDKVTHAYKKQAITLAIARARGHVIVTTDADCIAGKQWLASLSNYYTANRPDMITMPVRVRSRNTPLGVFETLDFLSLQGMTGALVSRSNISMANGANLCYTKEIFNRVDGFTGIDHVASGDDMLLAEKIRMAGGKISYLKNENVIIETAGAKNISSFLSQRIRWASKTGGYKDKKIQSVLGLVYFLNLCLILLLYKSLTGCACNMIIGPDISFSSAFIYLVSAKTIAEMFFLWPVAGFFKQRYLLWFFPLAQLPHILYVVFSGFLGMFGSYEWKGRKVK
jgi:cellulose synthase/poly-beta-1,6-N-acetylglucosamine synthase-like glycosyltransferase